MTSRTCRIRSAGWALAAGVALVTFASSPADAQEAAGSSRPAVVGAGASQTEPAVPATTPITDLLTRMDALEAQVARLTAQNEELANHQHQLEARLSPAAPAATDSTAALTPATPPAPSAAPTATATNLAAMTGGASNHPAGPAHPSAERIAAVKAVIKPQTGTPGLDEYSYGFRLYTAKFYPEAAQQLKLYIDKYPHDAHISHARNLLGRAYLDDGKPRDAAPWFLTNYKTDPQGARAADSLLNLAEAMRQLGDNSRACIALNEFATTYAVEAQGRLRADYARTHSALTCS